MSDAQRAALGELLAYLEGLAEAHREAGRLGATEQCMRFVALVREILN